VCSFSFGTGMGRDQRLSATARDALLTAQGVNSIRKPSCLALLHELFEITGYWSSRPIRLEAPVAPRQTPFPISTEWRRCFLSLAVRFGLSAFVDNSLKQIKDDRDPHNVPLLSFALGLAQPRGIQVPPQPVWPSMVEVLLRHGANPNEPCASDLPSTQTLWQSALKSWQSELRGSCGDESYLRDRAFVIASMLQHGADPEVFTENTEMLSRWYLPENPYQLPVPRTSTSVGVLIDMIANKLPNEASELRSIVSQALTRSRRVQSSNSIARNSRKRSRNLYERPMLPGDGNVIDFVGFRVRIT
jgi:hypothetical protein